MKLDQARKYSTRETLSRGARLLRQTIKKGHTPGHTTHTGKFTAVRSADHNGHKIDILTRYEIRVDGRPLKAALNVDNSGRVTCHAVPNYVSVSAVEVVKQIVDAYPDSFRARRPEDRELHRHASGRPRKAASKKSSPKAKGRKRK